jgi:hypothetical protein
VASEELIYKEKKMRHAKAKGDSMVKMVLFAATGLCLLTATLPANAGVDLNVHVGTGIPAPPPPPVMVVPGPPAPPAPPYVVVRKGDRGRHLGHYKHKVKYKKHKGHK